MSRYRTKLSAAWGTFDEQFVNHANGKRKPKGEEQEAIGPNAQLVDQRIDGASVNEGWLVRESLQKGFLLF